MKSVILTFLFLIIYTSVYAQSGTVIALKQIQQTDFFQQYNAIRGRAENSVRNFKMIQSRYSEDEVQNVMYSYNASAEYFNATLYNIKNDLLQKDKRKYMVAYPDAYSKQIEADLFRAKEFYSNTFQKEITHVTNGQITGSALLALLPQVLKYAQMAMQMFQQVKGQIKKMNEQVIEQYLIEPYKFKSWDEIN